MTVYKNYDVIAFKSCIQIFTVYCGLNIILTPVSNGRTSMKSCKASEFLTPSHRVDKTESSSCCYVFISLKPNGKFFLPLILIYIFLVRVLIENISPHCTAKSTLNWKSEYVGNLVEDPFVLFSVLRVKLVKVGFIYNFWHSLLSTTSILE